VSTNAYLRKIHNFLVDMNWLPATVIPRRQWPAIHYKDKRAITIAEHQKIVAAEANTERKTKNNTRHTPRLRRNGMDREGRMKSNSTSPYPLLRLR
jgi:hypothetical protein